MSSKKSIKNQRYENYWKLTLEYSDIYGISFNKTLELIVNFIDDIASHNRGWNSSERETLQEIIFKKFKKVDRASTRKSINQFFKLGFINNFGKGYHPLTKNFLSATDKNEKNLIFSKILYDNSSFSRSYNNPNYNNETNFFIKTLEFNKSINEDELLGLIYTDISKYSKGYLNNQELNQMVLEINKINFQERKYNQRNYIRNIFKKLDEVEFRNNTFYLSGSSLETEKDNQYRGRDPYLQRLFKKELVNEGLNVFGKIICFVEKIPYPVLIASHIKPYKLCDEAEAFDKNNGLLLSKNLDSLFDLGYISFEENGSMIYAEELDIIVVENLNDYSLDPQLLNSKRVEYLKYHRMNVFKKG